MDQVTNFSVKVRIAQESYAHLTEGANDTPFRPGMSATVDILTARVEGALSAPIQAVTSRNAGFGAEEGEDVAGPSADGEVELGVFVLENGEARWTPVQTGIQDARHVVLLGQLEEGTTVVTGPYDVVSRSLNHMTPLN